MSGLEVAAAVFGIISGIGSATKMAKDLRTLFVERKRGKDSAARAASETIERRLERLEKQLRASEAALQKYRRPGTISSRGLPNNALQACTATLENLTAKLRHIEAISPEIALQAPDTLNLPALEQLLDQWQTEADRVIQLIQSSQQKEGNRIVVPINLAGASLSNLCPNAILYRNNQCSFDQVAVSCHRAGSIQEWACRLCGAIVSRASMPLSLAKSGSAQVYITPVGFFKGHGARHEAGTWSCIWEKRLKECSDSFDRKRDLLRHMQEIHVKSQRNIGMFDVDFPADGRELSPAKCGYGVSITGDEMRIGKGRFVVP